MIFDKNLNMRTHYNETLLFDACKEKNMMMVNLLIEKGATPDICDRYQTSPLSYAVQNNNFDAVRALIKMSNLNPNIKDNKFNELRCTALYYAVKNNSEEMVDLLLQHPKIDLDMKYGSYGNKVGNLDEVSNGSKGTILHIACKEKKLAIINKLLAAGANGNIRDSSGKTAIYYAVRDNSEEVLDLLLKHPQINFNMRYEDTQMTLLEKACEEKNLILIEKLLAAGANINLRDLLGKTVIYYAVKNNSEEVLNLLLKHPQIDLNTRYEDTQMTLLHIAVQDNNIDAVEKLLAAHANIDAINGLGMTVLHIAINNKNQYIVKLLLKAGADIDIQDKNGYMAIQLAKDFNIKDMIRTEEKNRSFAQR